MSGPALFEADLDHAVDLLGDPHQADSWEALRGARILTTGTTGFLGTWLLSTWSRANARFGLGGHLVVITRREDAARARLPAAVGADPSISFVQADIREIPLELGSFTYGVHAAAVSASRTPYEQDPLGMYDTLVLGTRRVADVFARTGVRRALFVSSGAVYGPMREGAHRWHEQDAPGSFDPRSPASTYGLGKLAAELAMTLAGARHGFDVSIARCFAFVGPYLPLDAHFAAGNFLRDGLSGGPIRVLGDPRTVRSYLHGAELAGWLWASLLRAPPPHALHIGDHHPVTIGELASLIARHTGTEVQTGGTPTSTPSRYVPDTHLTRDALRLPDPWPLDEALRRTLRWYRNPPGAR